MWIPKEEPLPDGGYESVMTRTRILDNGCVIFRGAKINGYGCVRVEGSTVLAHRVVWSHFFGPIEGELHHVCGTRSCVNVEHLLNMSKEDHTRLHRAGKRRSHCKRGHELTPENRDVAGACRVCRNARNRDYYYRGGKVLRDERLSREGGDSDS